MTPPLRLWISLLLLALAACSGNREPAERLLGEIDAAVLAAGPDAVKYVPEQLQEVEAKLGMLELEFQHGHYRAVLAGAPPVLAQARELGHAAAARKAEITQDLTRQWGALSVAVSADLTAIGQRLEFLGEPRHRKLAAGFDLEAARSSLSSATSLWSKAQGAFGNNNLEEAVPAAREVQHRLERLAASLDLALPAPEPAAPAAARS